MARRSWGRFCGIASLTWTDRLRLGGARTGRTVCPGHEKARYRPLPPWRSYRRHRARRVYRPSGRPGASPGTTPVRPPGRECRLLGFGLGCKPLLRLPVDRLLAGLLLWVLVLCPGAWLVCGAFLFVHGRVVVGYGRIWAMTARPWFQSLVIACPAPP